MEGRVQLRLEAGGEAAEGFVAAPGFGTIRARAGSALASMLAVLKDMQTPEDVAAIMEWVRANPRALGTPTQFRSGGVSSGEWDDPLVDASRVAGVSRRSQEEAGDAGRSGGGHDEPDWQRFVGRLLGATARARPREEEQADDDDPAEAKRRSRARMAAEKLSLRFPAIFHKLEGDVRSDVELVNLLGLTSFVCVTTAHPMAATFMQRLATIAERFDLGPVARDVFAWCLFYLAAGATTFEAATTRARMLVLGIDPERDPDPEYAVPALAELIAPAADVRATVEAIRRVRTVHEDVRALEAGVASDFIPEDLHALRSHPRWDAMVKECAREPGRRRIHFVEVPRDGCPQCNITLLPHLRSELRRLGVCESACHGFILARNPSCPTR